MRDGRTWRIQQHLLACGATNRVRGAWLGRANPLSSRNHRATAIPEATVTKSYPAVLLWRPMTWLARPGISAHCARGTSALALNGLISISNMHQPIHLTSSAMRNACPVRHCATLTCTCKPQVRRRLQMCRACSGACRDSERAWSARNGKNHVGRGLALPLPPLNCALCLRSPFAILLGPHARLAAGPPKGRHR
jgi:hypothetical protein